jgi:hypothetical protein
MKALLLALLIASCGSREDADNEPAPTPTPEATPTPIPRITPSHTVVELPPIPTVEPVPEPTVVVVYAPPTPTTTTTYEQLYKACMDANLVARCGAAFSTTPAWQRCNERLKSECQTDASNGLAP